MSNEQESIITRGCHTHNGLLCGLRSFQEDAVAWQRPLTLTSTLSFSLGAPQGRWPDSVQPQPRLEPRVLPEHRVHADLRRSPGDRGQREGRRHLSVYVITCHYHREEDSDPLTVAYTLMARLNRTLCGHHDSSIYAESSTANTRTAYRT